MKVCPGCSYPNADQAEKCHVCGGSLSGAAVTVPVPDKTNYGKGWLLLFSGMLLLTCAMFCFRAPPAVPGRGPVLSPESAFNYSGVLASLRKMKTLRFLPLKDRRGAAELLYSPDEKVGAAAAELAGEWARFSAEPAARDEFFRALLKAAAGGRGAARRQAAMEAGVSALYSRRFAPYAPEMRRTVAGLMREKDEGLNAAGFFLASMAGFSDLVPELDRILAAAPSPYLKLYAACALSRLGGEAGHKYLFSAALAGGQPGIEAVSCLSYSVSPEAMLFLEKAAAGAIGPQAAVPARNALILRKQLAIIKQ
ncbi:MAG: hypothetical protein WCK76_02395 [Elusimicrobiota bacterium]